jgi:flagellar biosynthetic protein FliQ
MSLFQSVTSIQEQTLTFAPKLLALAGLLILLAPGCSAPFRNSRRR